MSWDKSHLSLKSNLLFTSCHHNFFIFVCIGRHMYHIYVHMILLDVISNVFQCLIYFLWSICTSFRLFRVPVNFLIQSVRFWKICNKMILWYTSEIRIWFPTVTFIMLIIGDPWIKGWFLIAFFFSLYLKEFLSWVWASTVTVPWLRKFCSLIIPYWIFQIQIIDLQYRYRKLFLFNNFSSLLNSAWRLAIWTDKFPPS